MKDKELNEGLTQAIDAIKADQPPRASIERARDRVHEQMLSQSRPNTGIQLDSLEDYIEVIPDYLADKLSDSQRLLFEEESRRSLVLRRKLKVQRQLSGGTLEVAEDKKTWRLGWLASAAAIVLLAVGIMVILPELPTLDQSRMAKVMEVNGSLYRVADGQLQPLKVGEWIEGQTNVRTGKDSLAILRLDDGSRVEVDSRSELSVTRRSSGNRIDIERGNIIVEASPQGSGTLDVATNEFVVSVTGTIFEVGHGAMGSMVGVIEGQVEVLQKGESTSVTPGRQMGSRMGLENYDAKSQLSWSSDGDKYIAMLKSVDELQRGISKAMETEPRYSTRLLDLVPENTAIYLAVPNAPEKITDVYAMMRSHMQKEGFASALDNIDHASENQHLDELMSWLGEVGSELGAETVVSMTILGGEDELRITPVLLSVVDAEAFTESFDSRVEQLHALLNEATESGESNRDDGKPVEIVLLKDPDDAVQGNLSIWLANDILVATLDTEVMKEMKAIIASQQSAFSKTEFRNSLAESYSDGAEFLAGVHLAEVLKRTGKSAEKLETVGVADAKFLIAESTQTGRQTTLDASLIFNEERQGVMSWLAKPGPMGALEFFSVYSTMVTSFVLKDPLVIIEEIERMASALGEIQKQTEDSSSGSSFELNLDWKNDIVATLGGEVAFGLDGPAFPTPGWKAVVEVFDELQLQASIEQVIEQVNQEAFNHQKEPVFSINESNVGPYTGYQLTVNTDQEHGSPLKTLSIVYVFIDGYLVAAPSTALLDKAITLYQSGAGLMTSSEFISQLPEGAGLDFSAMTFSRVSKIVSELIDFIPSDMSAEQQSAIKEFSKGSGPTLVTVYAAPESLRFIHKGSTDLSFSISQLLSLNAIRGINEGSDLNEVFGEGFAEKLEEAIQSSLDGEIEGKIEGKIEFGNSEGDD